MWLLTHFVPAHVRHFQALAARQHHFVIGEALDVAGKDAERRHIAFVTVLEQHLFADADAEKRLVLGCSQHCAAQAAGVEFGHAVGHRTLTGEDDALGGRDDGRISGDNHRLAASNMFQRLGHRTQVTHAVVDDGDRATSAHRVPNVDGTAPAMRGSGGTAMRRARPKALKMVSAWWWAFLPRRLSMCSVTPAWLTSPWKNSLTRSTSKLPIIARENSTFNSSPGRPERSITTRDSASSSGT